MTSHALNRLSATRVSSIKEAGRYADGGGLFLFVDATRRRWLFRYTWHGSKKEVGLGSARSLSLAKAREKAAEYRAMVSEGKNPKAERAKADRRMTFGEYADSYIETMSPSWKNPKHIAQWKMTLTVYAAPLRSLMLHEIDTDDVLKVLKPHWSRVPETSDRLRGRIENVLDAAKANGLREGEKPRRRIDAVTCLISGESSWMLGPNIVATISSLSIRNIGKPGAPRSGLALFNSIVGLPMKLMGLTIELAFSLPGRQYAIKFKSHRLGVNSHGVGD